MKSEWNRSCIEQNLHGGDVYRHPVKLDFSVNINPLGIPPRVQEAIADALQYCTRYPEYGSGRLIQAVAAMEGVPEEMILCGNGASELFPAVVHALSPKKTLIPVPSFYGYERAAKAGGGEIRFFPLSEQEDFLVTEALEEALDRDDDLLFLANPNNPTGKRISGERLERILGRCRTLGIRVVLDECFLDFTQGGRGQSMVPSLSEYPNLIVVRAFTKLYALPGVRLGYLLCADRILRERIALQLPEWNVSVFAQAAGIAAAAECGFRQRTPDYIKKERNDLLSGLAQAAPWLKVYPGDANFLLLRTEYPLYGMLLERGILIRDCSSFRGLSKGYYRIAVKRHEENEILLNTIRDIEINS